MKFEGFAASKSLSFITRKRHNTNTEQPSKISTANGPYNNGPSANVLFTTVNGEKRTQVSEGYVQKKDGNEDIGNEKDMEHERDVVKETDDVDSSSDQGRFAATDLIDPPPDGGYGWVCCAMIALSNFSTWGSNSAYGVFLSYYLRSNYFPDGTKTDFALIGGLVIMLTVSLVPLSCILMEYIGYRYTVSIGIILQAAGYIGASFAKKIWQLYLAQGVCIGVAFGIIFGANSIILPNWFLHKRALVNGISHSGIGLGGIVFSLSVNKLIQEKDSPQWALRMLAIMTFVLSSISMLLIKVRKPNLEPSADCGASVQSSNPSSPIFYRRLKSMFDWKVWFMLPVVLSTTWASLCAFGYVIHLFSLSNYATSIHLSTHQGTVVLAIFNAGQAIGRPAMGYFSERIGRVNFTIIATTYCGFLVFAFWFQCDTYAKLIAYSIMSGFLVGIGSVNLVPLICDVIGTELIPAGLGFGYMMTGVFSLIAEVIGLQLRDDKSAKPYRHCQIFVGCMYFAAVVFLFPYREWRIRRILNARRNKTEVLNFTIRGYFQRMFYNLKI